MAGQFAALSTFVDPAEPTFFTMANSRYSNQFLTLYRCGPEGGDIACTYYNPAGDALWVRMRPDRLGNPYAIVAAKLTPLVFPTDYRQYGQLVLDSWQTHNLAATSILTGQFGESAFAGVPEQLRGAVWTYAGITLYFLSLYHTWRSNFGGKLYVVFGDGRTSGGPLGAPGQVSQVRFSP